MIGSPPQIIVADDDRTVRTVIVQALNRQGYDVLSATTIASMWDMLTSGKGELLITDVGFPDGDALELLPRIQAKRPELKIIVLSARSNLLTAIKTQQRDVSTYLPKPFELKALIEGVKSALTSTGHAQQTDAQKTAQMPQHISASLLGKSPAMQMTFKQMAKCASQPYPVLIQAEPGTDKLEVARTLCEMSGLSPDDMSFIDLTAAPAETHHELVFGEQGLSSSSEHKAVLINGIEMLDGAVQQALSRYLTTLSAGAAGSGNIHLKRIFLASHVQLASRVEQGRFREDLFSSLASGILHIPPLRNRKEDITLLAQHICEQLNAEQNEFKTVEPSAHMVLQNHDWPGNVTELISVITKAYHLTKGTLISAETAFQLIGNTAPGEDTSESGSSSLSDDVRRHLQRYFAAVGSEASLAGLHQQILDEVEKPLIETVLRYTSGNQLKAAQILGLNRNTLRKKISLLTISTNRADYKS